METKGELAAVMAKRLARQSIGSDTSRDSISSMEIGPSGNAFDESDTLGDTGDEYARVRKENIEVSDGSAKNFFMAKEQAIMSRRASLNQEDIIKKEKEDAKREVQERADKRKAFQQRMAVFNK